MNLPVLYRVDQPTSNVVVFRGAQVALARQSGILAPTPPSVSGLGAKAKTKASPTYAYGPPSTSPARAHGDVPLRRTYNLPIPRAEATGRRKVSNDEYRDRHYDVSWGWRRIKKASCFARTINKNSIIQGGGTLRLGVRCQGRLQHQRLRPQGVTRRVQHKGTVLRLTPRRQAPDSDVHRRPIRRVRPDRRIYF